MSKANPVAYILIRNSLDRSQNFLENALRSVINQDYDNKKVILIQDKKAFYSLRDCKIVNLKRPQTTINLDKFKNSIDIEVVTVEAGCPAATSLEAKRKFVQLADDDDVALFLDDDDEFCTQTAISSVMNKFRDTKANMCLVGIVIEDKNRTSLVGDDKKIYDKILDEIAAEQNAISYESKYNLHAAVSMGCSKAYKKEILLKYLEIINSNDIDAFKNKNLTFSSLKRYEDFPDFMLFLLKELQLSAVNENIYKYIQHSNRVTVHNEIQCFKLRISFLHYLRQCIYNYPGYFIENSGIEVENFIKFKLYIITTVVKKMKLQYNIDNLITDYEDIMNTMTPKNIKTYKYAELESFYNTIFDSISKKN